MNVAKSTERSTGEKALMETEVTSTSRVSTNSQFHSESVR